jgi:hypothetical protein
VDHDPATRQDDGRLTRILTNFLFSSTPPTMRTCDPPRPATDLPAQLYYQLLHTLTALLPPPLDDTQEALRARNHAAIAKVATLLPVNPNEADLAAQCIAARAHAEDVLRLLRQHADDIGLVMRLNAQYGSMVRTSLAVHGRLMRVQALRQKRESFDGALDADARAGQVVERSMPVVADARSVEAAPVEALANCVDPRGKENVSLHGMNSHIVGFETRMSQHSGNWAAEPSGKTHPGRVLREANAESRLGRRERSANGRESCIHPDWFRDLSSLRGAKRLNLSQQAP